MEVDYERIERDGKVAYKRGDEVLMVPSVDACYNRLFKLLEEVHGDIEHVAVRQFWNDRTAATIDPDAMKVAHAMEVIDRLEVAWEKLTNPQPESDLFADFDL